MRAPRRAGLVGSEKDVVRGIGSQLLVAAQLHEEEALESTGIAAIQLFESCIAACRSTRHQLLVSLLAQGFQMKDAHFR